MHHSAIYPNCVAPLKLANSVSSGSQHGKAIATSCRRWLTKKKAKKLFSVTYKSLGCFENKREKNLFYSNIHSLNKTAKPLVITVQVGLLLCIKNISPPTMRERALILNKAIEKNVFELIYWNFDLDWAISARYHRESVAQKKCLQVRLC